jgi:Zn-finger nucleic acid-binding protein
MQRRNFRKSSGVILDICRGHGVWLDADELEQIAGFLLAGGETSAAMQAEVASAERAYQSLRAERRADLNRGSFTVHTREHTADESLLDLFAGIFDLK